MVIIFTQCDCTYRSFLNCVYYLAMVGLSPNPKKKLFNLFYVGIVNFGKK